MKPTPRVTGGAERSVRVRAGAIDLEGRLGVPDGALGVVAFAHGGGSGRLSPRNAAVAAALREAGLATLLFDLLDEAEANDRARVFDIELLADRLSAAADWLAAEPETRHLALAFFGASTGAAAALVAAARCPGQAAAIVSRGGRPDLAREALSTVDVPTLLIVGGRDTEVLERNRMALERLGGPRRLAVVPGATHLFPEPGALEQVARLAVDWFTQWLEAGPRGAGARPQAHVEEGGPR